MCPRACGLLTLGQKQKTTGVRVGGELRETVGDCRCDLSSVNSKFHITVFSLIRFQELLSVCKMVIAKQDYFPGADAEAGASV